MIKRTKDPEKLAKLEAEYEGPPIPDAGMYLWGWYGELAAARGSGGFGPAAITYPDIDAWARLTGRRPAPWEISVIKAIDVEFLKVTGESMKRK